MKPQTNRIKQADRSSFSVLSESINSKSMILMLEADDQPTSQDYKKMFKLFQKMIFALRDGGFAVTSKALEVKGIPFLRKTLKDDDESANSVYFGTAYASMSAFHNLMTEIKGQIDKSERSSDGSTKVLVALNADVDSTAPDAAEVKDLISKYFKPNPKVTKFIQKQFMRLPGAESAAKLAASAKERVSAGRAAEAFHHNGDPLNEISLRGAWDSVKDVVSNFAKGLLTTSNPGPASTVQALLPFTGNVQIQKLLLKDFEEPNIGQLNNLIVSLEEITKNATIAMNAPSGTATPVASPDVSGGGGSDALGGGGGGAGGGAGDGGGGSGKTSIKSVTGLDNDEKASKVLDRVKAAEISVTDIGDDLSADQKKKLADALVEIEKEMRDKISDTFVESRRRKSDSLIIERWQHLAGIAK
jgi:hypothetical protein